MAILFGMVMPANAIAPSATYYDSRDRAIQTVSTNHLGCIDRSLSAFDFAGRQLTELHRLGREGQWHTLSSRSYDALGRLTAADYSDSRGRENAISTAYSYDLNGNILSLSRMGVYDTYRGRVQYGLVDDLTLSYRGNRLQSVADNCYGPFYQGAYHFVDGADETEEYTYDANGNTDADLNRGITRSVYDINNRPLSIEFADGSRTSYLYDASGRKLRTIHEVAQLPVADPSISSSPSMVRRSVTDYCGAYVYEDSLLSRINIGGGYLSYTDYAGGRLTEPEYHYYLTDHLGNNRMDLTDGGAVWQAMDYYPFGMPMGSSYLPAAQRWLFGGKELDRTAGLDLYDQEARAYDPTLGRFRSTDPLAETYAPLSPYIFCGGDPLIHTDPDGKQFLIVPAAPPMATPLMSVDSPIFMAGRTPTEVIRTFPKEESHHIIPRQFKGESIVKEAVKQGYKFEGKENRINLPKYDKATNTGRHGNHPNYNQQIKQSLEKMTNDPGSAIDKITDLVSKVIETIKNNPDVKINDLEIKSTCPADNTKVNTPPVLNLNEEKQRINNQKTKKP